MRLQQAVLHLISPRGQLKEQLQGNTAIYFLYKSFYEKINTTQLPDSKYGTEAS